MLTLGSEKGLSLSWVASYWLAIKHYLSGTGEHSHGLVSYVDTEGQTQVFMTGQQSLYQMSHLLSLLSF